MHVVGAEAGGGVAAAVFVLIQNISQIHCILELSFKMSTALFGGELVCRFRLQSAGQWWWCCYVPYGEMEGPQTRRACSGSTPSRQSPLDCCGLRKQNEKKCVLNTWP